MLTVPSDKTKLITFTKDLIEKCRISVGSRSAYYRMMNTIAETGRYDQTKSLVNMMHNHLDRTASHLFSPVELKFTIGFDNIYGKKQREQANIVARLLTKQWAKTNTDTAFGRGVFEALKYGACLLKQWVQSEGLDGKPVYYKKLVMPWQFGVYNEAENELDRQPALCETTILTLPEVWRRIWHLPDAKKLYDRIKTHARKGEAVAEPQSFFHQVLSSNTLSSTGLATANRPGGIVALGSDANYGIMGPQVGADIVNVHELWVQDDEDYTTIIFIEPDIVVAPLYKKANLLISDSKLQPYRLIQPNEVTNWFWGRSELVDLIEPQMLLSRWCDDAARLFGLQVDKLLGFIGESGMTDERYGAARNSGYFNLDASSKIEDITPKIFPEMLPMIRWVQEMINILSGFPEIMQGKGEPGVRAGVHANTLLKTASPTLRDRALLVERQCATAADLTMAVREAKDDSRYWIKADKIQDVEDSSFLISDLPSDWCVSVDSHSSSPIFSDEHAQLIMAGLKMGIVGPRYAADNLPFPNKDDVKIEQAEMREQKQRTMQQLMQENPAIGEQILKKEVLGGRR